MKDTHETCEHCGGMVGEDGLAIVLPEEPSEDSVEAVDEVKRDFAKAIASRKEG